jgi:hypothetical protein
MTIGPTDLLANPEHMVRIYTPHHLKGGPTRLVFATASEAQARYAEMENDAEFHTGSVPRIRKVELVIDGEIVDRAVQLHNPTTMR